MKRSLWPSRLVQSAAIWKDSFPENGSLRETKHQADRIRHARQKADEAGGAFFINARTDLFIQVSQDKHDSSVIAKALERAEAYARAGADGSFCTRIVRPCINHRTNEGVSFTGQYHGQPRRKHKCTRKARRCPNKLRKRPLRRSDERSSKRQRVKRSKNRRIES